MIALDTAFGTYLGANAASTLLWRMLARGAPETELVDRLVAEFELEPVHASTDAKTFVVELRATGLLEA